MYTHINKNNPIPNLRPNRHKHTNTNEYKHKLIGTHRCSNQNPQIPKSKITNTDPFFEVKDRNITKKKRIKYKPSLWIRKTYKPFKHIRNRGRCRPLIQVSNTSLKTAKNKVHGLRSVAAWVLHFIFGTKPNSFYPSLAL